MQSFGGWQPKDPPESLLAFWMPLAAALLTSKLRTHHAQYLRGAAADSSSRQHMGNRARRAML